MSRTSISRTLTTCPACGKPIDAVFTIDVTFGQTEQPDSANDDLSDEVSLKGKVIGARIQHDCTPQVTR